MSIFIFIYLWIGISVMRYMVSVFLLVWRWFIDIVWGYDMVDFLGSGNYKGSVER